MRLVNVELRHFRSVRETLNLAIDSRVTVLLGANDHGKSNILAALALLNDDGLFTEDDRNWDTSPKDPTPSPAVIATYLLSEEEVAELTSGTEPPEGDETESSPHQWDRDTRILRFGRAGVPGVATLNDRPLSEFPPFVAGWLEKKRPRFELISRFSGETQDHVEKGSIQGTDSEFMQGIFFQAGLLEEEWSGIFAQTDQTTKRLNRASVTLNENLRGLWGQGADLTFTLRHDNGRIALRVEDPAVRDRVVRLSQKSTGVTHFFRLSMLLHARKMKAGSRPAVYLFDEPGVFLHPKGQRDLLRVFELIADESQIVIATHSLFLINLNYPERHRLVFLDENGTRVDHKPYTASWKMATDALGLSLGALSLFSEKVLLVEGETDPLYLYELIRQLSLLGRTTVDANDLGIVSFRDAQSLKYLIQLLSKDPANPKVAILLDGDDAGSATKKAVTRLSGLHAVPCFTLGSSRSIEDYCLDMEEFGAAIIEAITEAGLTEEKGTSTGLDVNLLSRLEPYRSWARSAGTAGGNPETLGRALNSISRAITGEGVSKVSVARRYVEKCREKLRPDTMMQHEVALDQERIGAALEILREISTHLALPEQKAAARILAEDPVYPLAPS